MTAVARTQRSIRSRPILICVATMVAYTASVILRRGFLTANPEAVIWLGGVLIVGLLLLNGKMRVACFVACFAVNVLSNVWFGHALRTYLTFPLAALITYLTLLTVGPGLNFAEPKRLARFLAFAVAPACALMAIVLLVVPMGGRPATVEGVGHWFVGHMLGSAILIPSLAILTRPTRFKGFRRPGMEVCSIFLLTLSYVAFLLWRGERSGWDLLAFPLAMFIAFRYGPVGVAVLSLMLTVLALAYLYGGVPHLGPAALSYAQTEWVQLFVALVLLTSLPAAGAVASFQRMQRLFGRRTLTARSARRRADAAAQAKSEFLANMSHEIRTPLNGVIGLADALSRTPVDRGQKEMLDMILSSGETLRGLLSDALDLARAEAGSLTLAQEPFDLRQTIGAASYLFETLAQEKGLEFKVAFDVPEGCLVVGDALRIRQIVSNFISNAVKFTEQGGVEVETSLTRLGPEQGRLTVAVRDTGLGFDEETKARLFNRFEQGDSSVTRRYGGTGLGLSIARKLAQMMGGEVTCDAAPGLGAVFRFSANLPLEATANPAGVSERTGGAAAEAFDGRLRVLLAEDHQINQKVVQAILGDQVRLVIVGDGQAAVDLVGAQAFDVILMDTHMPVMDGLSAIRRIRALEAERGGQRVPIISLTADAMPQQVQAALAAGANRHLAKPITADSLFATLVEVLQHAPGDEDVRQIAGQ